MEIDYRKQKVMQKNSTYRYIHKAYKIKETHGLIETLPFTFVNEI